MARIYRFGQPENASESKAIRWLAERLPDSHLLVHNFELTTGYGMPYEYDIAVVGGVLSAWRWLGSWASATRATGWRWWRRSGPLGRTRQETTAASFTRGSTTGLAPSRPGSASQELRR